MLRPGGRLAFHTIELAPGLTGSAREQAVAAGPPAVAVRTSYDSLLRSAGFTDARVTDLTAEYATVHLRWTRATEAHEAELRPVLGDDEFEDRTAAHRQTDRAIVDGLLRRYLYVVTR